VAKQRSHRRERARRVSPPTPEVSPTSVAAPARRVALWTAGLTVLACGLLFVATLAPTVTLVDSGELILAAHGLGVGHPPGFPTYLLLTSAFTHLPWPDGIAWRANLGSALAAAAACGALVLAAWQAWRPPTPRGAAQGPLTPVHVATLGLPGLLLGCGHTLWNYATVAEVYALNTLLLASLWATVLAARHHVGPVLPLLAVLLAGLGLGVHHVTLGLSLPALAWVLLARRPELRSPRALGGLAVLLLLVTASVYAYLPWAAGRGPLLNWGEPNTWPRFVAHISGRQYQAFIAPTAASMRAEAADFLALFAREHGPLLVLPIGLLVAAGVARLLRHDRALLAACLLNVGADLAFALVYTVAEDKDAYALPTRVVVALLAGLGAASLAERASQRGLLRHAVAGLLIVLPLAAAVRGYRHLDRSAERVAPEYVADVLAPVGAAGLVLTSDWQVYAPALYLRGIEGWRPDVCLVDVSLLRRSWYLRGLDRRCPRLAPRVAVARAAFAEDLLGWEAAPERYAQDAALLARINARFQTFVGALVDAQLDAGGQAYATNDVLLAQASPDPALARVLAEAHTLVPRALVFELRRTTDPVALAPLALTQRALFDGRRVFPADDVARLKVLPAYLSMVVNRAQYLAFHGDLDGARDALRQALTWRPDYPPARQAWQRLEARRTP
jgi:hypothetical protein